jgi:hypothetical protein
LHAPESSRLPAKKVARATRELMRAENKPPWFMKSLPEAEALRVENAVS